MVPQDRARRDAHGHARSRRHDDRDADRRGPGKQSGAHGRRAARTGNGPGVTLVGGEHTRKAGRDD